MTFEHASSAERAEARRQLEARRQDRILKAQASHLAAHRALAQRHATEPPVGSYAATYQRQTEERKALDDTLGEEVRRAEEAFYTDVLVLGLNSYRPNDRQTYVPPPKRKYYE